MSLWPRERGEERKERMEGKRGGGRWKKERPFFHRIVESLHSCGASPLLLNAVLRHAVPLTRDFLGTSHSL